MKEIKDTLLIVVTFFAIGFLFKLGCHDNKFKHDKQTNQKFDSLQFELFKINASYNVLKQENEQINQFIDDAKAKADSLTDINKRIRLDLAKYKKSTPATLQECDTVVKELFVLDSLNLEIISTKDLVIDTLIYQNNRLILLNDSSNLFANRLNDAYISEVKQHLKSKRNLNILKCFAIGGTISGFVVGTLITR